jgi:eukaryotic-like serine/threonine-protein kinase
VQRVEARSGPAYLEVDRGACAPSVVFLQRLPGYNERAAVPVVHVFVPTCQATIEDTIEIPAGEFLRNIGPPEGGTTRDERAHLDAFAIDRTEVTRAAFRVYGHMEALTGEGAARPDDPQTAAEEDRLPVVGINFMTARDYCRFLGKDLPSVEQWQKAARGGLEIAGRPNQHPERVTTWVVAVGPRPANLRYSDDSEIAEVASYPEDTSPYGVVDMIGNVAEWSRSRPVATNLKRLRTVLGSSWDIAASLDIHQITFRNSRHDRYLDFTIGLRCVAPVSRR